MASLRQLESEPRLPQPGDVLGGKYRVERMIARGGMGAVFVAMHEVTGGRVALKWLLGDADNDTENTLRLIREARTAVRVRHANVVDVYDVGEHGGSLFLVMELLEGETLSGLLQRRGALPVEEALQILLPTMRGVQAAHRNQVIHRDLKPNNIFLCSEEGSHEVTPRVLDFGISKVMALPGDPEHSLTQTGAVIGTPYYMAPEQLTDLPIDHRIDVYALGVILYQTLTGRLPFVDTNYNALVVQIATAVPTPLGELRKDLPAGLEDVVLRAMARKPEARYETVAALIAALMPFTQRGAAQVALSTPPTAAAVTPVAALPAAPSPRVRWALALVATLAALLLGWWWTRTSAPAPVQEQPPMAASQPSAPEPIRAAAPSAPVLQAQPKAQPQPTATPSPAATAPTPDQPPAAGAIAKTPSSNRVRSKHERKPAPVTPDKPAAPKQRPIVDISPDQF